MSRFAKGKPCPRCKGYGTLYTTEGKLTLCPECLGAGEVELLDISELAAQWPSLESIRDKAHC